MKRAYFITGTDTGVGKTFIACGLARAFMAMNLRVGVMKPVETGCRVKRGALIPADALALMEAASSATFLHRPCYHTRPRQRKVVLDALDIVNPYRFKTPVAPNIAARLERKKISLAKIKKAFKAISGNHDVTLVEGAGGILSPVTDNMSNADLALHLGLPVIIVAPQRLGAVNQSLLAIEAAQSRRLTIAAVVLNDMHDCRGRAAMRYNRAEIERLGRVRVVGVGCP